MLGSISGLVRSNKRGYNSGVCATYKETRFGCRSGIEHQIDHLGNELRRALFQVRRQLDVHRSGLRGFRIRHERLPLVERFLRIHLRRLRERRCNWRWRSRVAGFTPAQRKSNRDTGNTKRTRSHKSRPFQNAAALSAKSAHLTHEGRCEIQYPQSRHRHTKLADSNSTARQSPLPRARFFFIVSRAQSPPDCTNPTKDEARCVLRFSLGFGEEKAKRSQRGRASPEDWGTYSPENSCQYLSAMAMFFGSSAFQSLIAFEMKFL